MNPDGYARLLIKARLDQDLVRPPFVKPFLRYPDCCELAAYFLQLGAVLGSLHREHADAFQTVLLGRVNTTEDIADIDALTTDPMSFTDFIHAKQARKQNFTGPLDPFIASQKTQKVLAAAAEEIAMQAAEDGAILGALRPDTALKIFAYTHDPSHEKKSDATDQDRMAFDVVARGENQVFMSYCRQSFPDLFQQLSI
jgi:hypothetical protein